MTTPRPGQLAEETMNVAAAISQAARAASQSVAVAESLTSGSLASNLGAAEASSEWFVGGIIAYSSEVKFTVLGVDRGPVITDACAAQMAVGVARLTAADFSVAVTGAGGPGEEEGKPAGTVFIAVHSAAGTRVEEHHFGGEAAEVVHATTFHALEMLRSAMQSGAQTAQTAQTSADSTNLGLQ